MDKHAKGEDEADPKDGYFVFEKAIPHIYVYVRIKDNECAFILGTRSNDVGVNLRLTGANGHAEVKRNDAMMV